MLRQVRGSGTLVPEDVRWITANVDGRVERITALPSSTSTVKADTILLELSNPEVEKNALEAESQLKAAQADSDNMKAQLDSALLNQQGKVTEAESNEAQAKLLADANKVLAKDGLIPDLSLKTSVLRYEQGSKASQIERERYLQTQQSNAAQLAAQRARVAQLQALYDLRRREVDSLKVRAGIPGVLQELPLQVGQRATAGTNLPRVARPENLKAQVRIPETQAKDVMAGQKASIDTRNGLIDGHVQRVAPSVQEGTVIVDVVLDGA